MKTTSLIYPSLLMGILMTTQFTFATENEMANEQAPVQQHTTNTYQPLEPGYVPFKGEVTLSNSQYSYRVGNSNSGMSPTQSCIALLKAQQGGYVDTEKAIMQSAAKQTNGGAIIGTSNGVLGGIVAGIATANPLIGVGVGAAYLTITAIGTEMNRAKIMRNGNTASAAEKILSRQELTKKESKAFEKTRKKVSKKVYGNKEVLSDVDFAQTVVSQGGIGEKLFCDIDKNGRIKVLAQSKTTIKRLELAQKCKDSERSRSTGSAR